MAVFDKLKQKLPENLIITLKKFALPLAVAVAATAIVVGLLWQSNNGYTMLYGSQERLPITDVVQVLSGEGISYRVEPKSGNLMVRESDLASARMALASKGITASIPAGYELMDKEEMLGSSQFLQNVRLKRSLEGELAKSVMTIDSVEYARVHLGITETSSFVLTNKPDSTASVVVRLKYGRQLSQDQVAAIVSLISGSVPGLKPKQVQVIDQHGTLLSAELDESDSGPGYRRGREIMQRLRRDTERSIATLLTPVVGQGNFRVSVVPRINLSQVEETQERYLNEPRVNSERLHQENTTEQLAIGIPGSLSNRPVNQAPPQNNQRNDGQNAQNGNQQMATRNDAERQFSWDRDIRHIRHQGFLLERLTVAVILNQQAPQLEKWDDQRQKQMLELLDSAAGIDSTRGDVLTLSRMAFTPEEVHPETIEPWWERDITLLWAERIGTGLLALLVILFGVLPMLRRIGSGAQAQMAKTSQATTQHDETSNEDNPDGDESKFVLKGNAFQSDENLPPQGSGLETKIAFLQTLAQNETDRVADVLKQWINNNERTRIRS